MAFSILITAPLKSPGRGGARSVLTLSPNISLSIPTMAFIHAAILLEDIFAMEIVRDMLMLAMAQGRSGEVAPLVR